MILERFPELAALSKHELTQLAWEILDEHFTFGDEEMDRQIHEAMMAKYEAFAKDPSLGIPWEESLAKMKRRTAGV